MKVSCGEIAQGIPMTSSSPDIHLLMIVWLLLCLLILLLSGLLFARYTRPTVRRVLRRTRTTLYRRMHCAWCWRAFHIMRWYPPRWSSTMCYYHRQQQRAWLAARRARLNATTRPILSAQHAQEVQQ